MPLRHSALAFLASALVACTAARAQRAPTGPTTTAPAPPAPAAELGELRWLPGGKSILVGQRWLLWPESRKVMPFFCTPRGRAAQADCRSLHVAFSSDGAQMVVLDGTWLALGPPEGPLGDAVPIPRWVGDAEAGEPTNIAFWVSNDLIFVEQLAPRDPEDLRCGTFTVNTRRWRTLRHCLEGGFSRVWRVEPGPGRWIAVYSGAEGQHSVDLQRYDSAANTVLAEGLSVSPAPSGPAYVRIHPDGHQVDVLSPCRVDQPHAPCPDDDGAPWNLYLGSTGPGRLRLVRSDLPRGAAMDPAGVRFAWPRGGSVCVGDPASASSSCVAVPVGGQ
jgi:hypothetical protein